MSGERRGGVELRTESGGSGGPVLAMLHGMGANAAVWRRMLPIVERRWPGRWVAVDLRGHGALRPCAALRLCRPRRRCHPNARRAGRRTGAARPFDGRRRGDGAGDRLVRRRGPPGLRLRRQDRLDGSGGRADEGAGRQTGAGLRQPGRAAARYLRVSGLAGLVGPDAPEALAGIVEAEGGYRLAADRRIYAAVGPAVADFCRAAAAPVRLAAGDADPMVALAEMQALDPQAALLPGLGHNCHVEAPERVWALSRHPSRARAGPSSIDPRPRRSAQIGTVLPKKIKIDRIVCLFSPIPFLLPMLPGIPILPPRTLRYAPALSRGYSG